MSNDKVEHLLNDIGHLIKFETSNVLAVTLLYAKVDHGMVSTAIFIEQKSQIDFLDAFANSLTYPLLELWENEPKPGRRWAEMEYLLHNGKFTATFVYPEQINPDEDEFDRRDRIVARYFGDKPIVYPPWPDDDTAQRFDL